MPTFAATRNTTWTKFAALIAAVCVLVAYTAVPTSATERDDATPAATAAAAPTIINTPAVTGTAAVGSTLTATSGTWAGDPTSYTYQWLHCSVFGGPCQNIAGATNSTYTVGVAVQGTRIRVRVTATNDNGSTAAESSSTGIVPDVYAPSYGRTPTLTGTAAVGSALTVNNGTWGGTTPITFTYQWMRCTGPTLPTCTDLPGVTGTTYTVTLDDQLHQLRALVTATNVAGTSAITTGVGDTVAAVTAPSSTALPSITGDTVAGRTLTVSDGTWDGTTPITHGYQWMRCTSTDIASCTDITDATDPTYMVTLDDQNAHLRARVTATNVAGSADVTSAPTSAIPVVISPTNIAAPDLSGNTTVGQTLSATNGTWAGTTLTYSYQWQRCDSAGANCDDVAGATNSTYTLTADDTGHRVRVHITAANAGGAATGTSDTTPVVDQLPTIHAPASVSGDAAVGETLAANRGTWAGTSPITYSYQWQRCDTTGANCGDVAGARSANYTVTLDDQDTTLRVRIDATNPVGTTGSLSSPTSAVPAVTAPDNTAEPAITGTLEAGNTLTAGAGIWSGTATITFTYQWLRCTGTTIDTCANIADATHSTYTLTLDDALLRFRVKVTATNVAGSRTATSNATASIPTASAPTSRELPTIGGAIAVGQTLTAGAGTWGGTAPITYSYQWMSCTGPLHLLCFDIPGATRVTYTVRDADLGDTINVRVRATNIAGYTDAYSTATDAVETLTPPAATGTPVVTGVAKVGETLSANRGTWDGTAPISYSYQWQRCTDAATCTDIDGATGASYVVVADDSGHILRVRITATNAGGSVAALSAGTDRTVAAPTNTAVLTITGTPTIGYTVAASPGTWSGTAPITYSYQWVRCSFIGSNCGDISGATNSTYTSTADDGFRRLLVRVTATNTAGTNTATSTFAFTVAAADRPTNTSTPTIPGTPEVSSTLTVDPGTWGGPIPITYSYQWLRCVNTTLGSCSTIDGAAGATYTVAVDDIGSLFRVHVTANNFVGNGGATSAPSAVVPVPSTPVNTAAPTLSGAAVDGATLVVTDGTWDGTAPLTYSYQWLRCDTAGTNCAPIGGADTDTYPLEHRDIGATIRAAVIADGPGGTATAQSDPSGVIAAAPPANTVAPVVIGSTVDGATLVVTDGTWDGTAPLAASYRWLRCDTAGTNCAPIGGADTDSYTLTGADIGATVTAEVTMTGPGGTASATSPPSLAIAGVAPFANSSPTLIGIAQVGRTLAASTGTWTGSSPVTYSTRWLRCDTTGTNCAPIGGADTDSYTLTGADIGATVIAEVTATNSVDSTSTLSAPTSAVIAAAALHAGDTEIVAGGDLVVRGAGYQPGSNADIYIHSDPVFLATVAVGTDGTFAATVTIPSGLAPGQHHIVVIGVDPAGNELTQRTPLTVMGPEPDTTEGEHDNEHPEQTAVTNPAPTTLSESGAGSAPTKGASLARTGANSIDLTFLGGALLAAGIAIAAAARRRRHT